MMLAEAYRPNMEGLCSMHAFHASMEKRNMTPFTQISQKVLRPQLQTLATWHPQETTQWAWKPTDEEAHTTTKQLHKDNTTKKRKEKCTDD